MGRTTKTFRLRTQSIRDKLTSILRGHVDLDVYKRLWEDINMFSSSATAFQLPDTRAVITYCMLLEVMISLDQLEQALDIK